MSESSEQKLQTFGLDCYQDQENPAGLINKLDQEKIDEVKFLVIETSVKELNDKGLIVVFFDKLIREAEELARLSPILKIGKTKILKFVQGSGLVRKVKVVGEESEVEAIYYSELPKYKPEDPKEQERLLDLVRAAIKTLL